MENKPIIDTPCEICEGSGLEPIYGFNCGGKLIKQTQMQCVFCGGTGIRKKQLKPTLVPLPCPFCGTTPKLAPQNPDKEGNAWGKVYCANSRCAAAPSVNDGQICADERGTGAYIDCAIRRWNKRA